MSSFVKAKHYAPRLGKTKLPNYWVVYTLVFAFVFVITYSYFWFAGKSLIWFTDGKNQHLISLVYYGVWLRDVLKNLISNHSFNIATYSFSFGYGGDIIQILHYYVIGDPLDVLTVFVPSSKTYILYQALIVVRLYLAGIAFSKLCFFFNKERAKASVLAGALLYVFGAFALLSASRHPYFINPMIYFPIVIIGAEKILKKEAPFVYIIGVFLSAVNNFYFFYMTVLFTVLYVFIRIIVVYREIKFKNALLFVLKLGIYALLGVAIAAVILLPVIIQFIIDPRFAADAEYDLVYNRSYYDGILNSFLSFGKDNNEWLYIGVGGLALPSIYTLFVKRKKRLVLKVGFVILTLFLFVPTVAYVFNGMSYVANRWTWGYSLLMAYIVADTADDMVSLNRRELIGCAVFLMTYVAMCTIIKTSLTANSAIQVLIALFVLFSLLVLVTSKKSSPEFTRRKSLIILAAAIIGVAFNAFYGFSPLKAHRLDKYNDSQRFAQNFYCNEAALLKQQYDGDFYRYTGNNLEKNVTLLNGNSSTQFFFSLSNPNIYEYFTELDTTISIGQIYENLDGRAALNTLANVEYYVSGSANVNRTTNEVKDANKKYVPYGFNKKHKALWIYDNNGKLYSRRKAKDLVYSDMLKEFFVYKNDNSLPFGYTYSSYVPRDDYAKLSSVQKQETMLQSVVLDKDVKSISKGNPTYTSEEIPFEFEPEGKRVTVEEGNKFVTTKENATVALNFKGKENCETYLYIKGLNFSGTNKIDLYNDDLSIDPLELYTQADWDNLSEIERDRIEYNSARYSEPNRISIVARGKSKAKTFSSSLDFYTQRFKWYEGKHDFIFNLGYEADAKKSILIELSERGVYSFDEIKVICQPMDNYSSQVKALKQDYLKKVNFHYLENSYATNEITGEISLKENKVLLLTIPYSDGWKAYVDGKETEILRANTMFSAIELSKGSHKIKLTYSTPYLKYGVLISAGGIFVFVVMFVVSLIVRRKRSK